MLGSMPGGHEIDAASGAVVVTLRGELDAHDAPRLKDVFAEALAAAPNDGGAKRLVLDLTAVGFLDSTVLGTMVGALRRSREAGGDMSVVLPDGPARRIFEITGLDKVVDIRPDRASATAG